MVGAAARRRANQAAGVERGLASRRSRDGRSRSARSSSDAGRDIEHEPVGEERRVERGEWIVPCRRRRVSIPARTSSGRSAIASAIEPEPDAGGQSLDARQMPARSGRRPAPAACAPRRAERTASSLRLRSGRRRSPDRRAAPAAAAGSRAARDRGSASSRSCESGSRSRRTASSPADGAPPASAGSPASRGESSAR